MNNPEKRIRQLLKSKGWTMTIRGETVIATKKNRNLKISTDGYGGWEGHLSIDRLDDPSFEAACSGPSDNHPYNHLKKTLELEG